MKGIIALGCIALSMFVTFVYGDSIPSKESNVKITVISDNDPLGYAYVYINGDIFTSTDSYGVAYISTSRLRTGDTISASFVGYQGGNLIYTGNSDMINSGKIIELKNF